MRESKEPIANLDMSSFIRYRRLQMPRMGNAHSKTRKNARDTQREILERFFPSQPPEKGVDKEKKLGEKDSLSGSEKDSLLDGLRSSNIDTEGNSSLSENESDFFSRDVLARSRDDLDSICSEIRVNRTRECYNLPCRGPRPHSTPPPRVGQGDDGQPACPGQPNDHSKGTKKVVGGRSRKIGVGSKLTSGHKYRYKDKTKLNTQNSQKLCSNEPKKVIEDDTQSNSGSDSALDTGSGSDAETVSRISISSDDGELINIEKLKKPTNNIPPRNIESPVNGYGKVLFVCNL